jgi:hypothetical protein
MNNKLIAGFIMALMVSQASVASGDNQHLGGQSLRVAAHLNEIAHLNDSDSCAGDVRIAAAYVESAGYALSRDKVQTASVSLVYAQNELKEISYNRSYCAIMASKIKPYLAEVILIKGELDAQNGEHAPDNTSD